MSAECPKCGSCSGNDWTHCGGSCPMPGSPHYQPLSEGMKTLMSSPFMATPPNKEQAYDAEVAPLMDKVIEICRREGISMIAHFELPIPGDPDLVCTSKTCDGEGNTSQVIRSMLRVTGLRRDSIIGRGGVPRSPL